MYQMDTTGSEIVELDATQRAAYTVGGMKAYEGWAAANGRRPGIVYTHGRYVGRDDLGQVAVVADGDRVAFDEIMAQAAKARGFRKELARIREEDAQGARNALQSAAPYTAVVDQSAAGDESAYFVATILRDGQVIATASNDGQGGCNLYRPAGTGDMHDVAQFCAFGAKWAEEVVGESFEGEDVFTSFLVDMAQIVAAAA